MKYDKHHIDKIIKSLEEGEGRVRACLKAGISYQTFINWLETKIEFFELIKKAEETGDDKIEDICKRRIIENTSWQSAAWWLERTKPRQYALNRVDENKELDIDKLIEAIKEANK
jgi:hypothetical protein